ncbi:MAG: hypothetical protein AAF211_08240 [Myxococcota bacterium]
MTRLATVSRTIVVHAPLSEAFALLAERFEGGQVELDPPARLTVSSSSRRPLRVEDRLTYRLEDCDGGTRVIRDLERRGSWLLAPLRRGMQRRLEVDAERRLSELAHTLGPARASRARDFDVRPFRTIFQGPWSGNGLSYMPFRDGESPDSEPTSKEHIRQDLEMLAQRWNLIRIYGWGEVAKRVLEVIRDHRIPMQVMQGAWLANDQTQEENDAQVQGVIEAANQFPDIVVALGIGNEIFVDWSAHRLDDPQPVIDYLRQARAAVKQPVTINDDYSFWNKPESKAIADELDFIGLHAYAFWNNQPLEEAAAWTRKIYADIRAMHPHHAIAFTEAGWPSSRVVGDGSYEGGLVGEANEATLATFFDWYDAWVDDNQIVSCYFEAFDESWKGGWDGHNPADKAEKHWGVYRSDRTPKDGLGIPSGD